MTSCKPPAAPWVPITPQGEAGSYVSVYLSSPLARLPVRDVNRLNDNKSDPNLETGTYGLFSTCEPIMRGSIKARGIDEIFFLTSVDEVRCLAGGYKLGWLIEFSPKDVALAATSMRFIDPIPVDRIGGAAGPALNKKLRNFEIVSEAIASELRSLLAGARDRTADYVSEIGRLERLSHARTGFRYPSWDREEPFSWDDAPTYLADLPGVTAPPNTSKTGLWVCGACGAEIRNIARLKVCNVCKKRDTLEPGPVDI